MKKLVQNILLILTVFTIVLSSHSEAFAIADRIKLHSYDLREGETIIPNCQLDHLDNIFLFDFEDYGKSMDEATMEDLWGDFSMDVSNLVCTAPLFGTYVLAKFGNTKVKAALWTTLSLAGELQYFKAQEFFKNASLCGDNWYVFKKEQDEAAIFGPFQQSHAYRVEKCLFGTSEEKNLNCNPQLGINEGITITNKTYREFLYDGKEYESDKCKDSRDERLKGYSGNNQRYYMRGRLAPNFACERFINNSDEYACCNIQSQQSLCIEYSSMHKFCDRGESCFVPMLSKEKNARYVTEVEMNIYRRGNRLCASTTNLCPFNHNLGGGSEKEKRYCDKNESSCECVTGDGIAKGCYAGVENFCQLYKHCSIIPNDTPYQRTSETSPYFDRACINFIGSSQNIVGENLVTGLISSGSSTYQGFSAPIVECIKETIENIFKNRAGHSRCLNPTEMPNNEVCLSGQYFYQMGQDLSEISGAYSSSSFSYVQTRLRTLVRLIIIFAITIYGVKTIIEAGGIERKTIMMLIVKIALIYYFVVGNAWKDIFFDGVYGASTSIGTIVMKVGDFHAAQMDEDENLRLDGCQFDSKRNPNYANYGDRTYLSIFDTIDCKILKYLGMDNQGIANIFIFALSVMLIGPVGIILFFSTLIFALFLISLVVKATYIFVISFIAISLIIYLSPIIIPMVLFEKTKNIFDFTVKNMLSFILQPIILYAYIGIFLTVLDGVVTGDAIYTGESPKKQLNCSQRCETMWGSILEDVKIEDCVLNDMRIVDPKENSLLCAFKTINDQAKPAGIFAPIGIIIPIIGAFISGRAFDIFLMFLKSIFVVYIVSSFLNIIPRVAAILTGVPSQLVSGDLFNKAKIFSILTGSYALLKIMSQMFRSGARATYKTGKGAVKSASHPVSNLKKWWNKGRMKFSNSNAYKYMKDQIDKLG